MANSLNNRDKSRIAELAKTDDLLEKVPAEEEWYTEAEEEEEDPDAIAAKEKEAEEAEEEIEEPAPSEEEAEEEEIEEPAPKEKKPVSPPAKTPDVDSRYQEQRREAQILHERNKQLTDAFLSSEEVKEPTNDELRTYVEKKGAAWDELTPFEREMAKDSFINTKRLAAVQGAVRDVKNIDEWAGKVDTFIDTNERTQTNKNLIGREGEFRAFAMGATHRGVPIEYLLSHFLMTKTSPVARKAPRQPLFATNAGGTREKQVNPRKITDADQAARLRTTDPRELKRRLLANEVDIEV